MIEEEKREAARCKRSSTRAGRLIDTLCNGGREVSFGCGFGLLVFIVG